MGITVQVEILVHLTIAVVVDTVANFYTIVGYYTFTTILWLTVGIFVVGHAFCYFTFTKKTNCIQDITQVTTIVTTGATVLVVSVEIDTTIPTLYQTAATFCFTSLINGTITVIVLTITDLVLY